MTDIKLTKGLAAAILVTGFGLGMAVTSVLDYYERTLCPSPTHMGSDPVTSSDGHTYYSEGSVIVDCSGERCFMVECGGATCVPVNK